MSAKKSFKVYYLLLVEGTTEFNLFAYLTKNKFKNLFADSDIQFSNKVEIIENRNQIISQGKLGGIGSIKDFKKKNNLIKARYTGQTLFFVLDKDLDDSSEIEALIKHNGDIVQFLEYNSEYLLLNFIGKNLKNPCDFKNLMEFRAYCKTEFQNQFKKKASEFKDRDFDLIFSNVDDVEIRYSFSELFSTLS
jgi:hypothetical protein